jgi:DNA-binding protein H-NS
MSTYRQLKQQIAELEKKASIVMKTEVRKVIESIKKQIAEFGLTAADLGLEVARRAGVRRATARKLVLKPKYRDPASGKTWNGHGKRPGWIVAAQDKGKLDDLLIDKAGRSKGAKAKPAAKSAAQRTKKAAPAAKQATGKAVKKKPAPVPATKRAAAARAAVKKTPAKPAPTAEKASAPPPAPDAAPAAA